MKPPIGGKAILLALFIVFLFPYLSLLIEAQDTPNIQSTTIKVYRDGLAHITQIMTVDEVQPEINLPLLSAFVENLIVLDANHLAVDFELSGSSLTIFTLGTTHISVEYDTGTLTNKQAEVWTIILNNPYNMTLFLPENSTIIYLNQIPALINTATNEVSLLLNPNQWEISYIIPLQQENSDNQNDDKSNTTFPIEYLIALSIVLALVIVIVIFVLMRKRKISVKKTINRNPHLSKEDKAVIEFLAEKDGKAFEAEIRQRFPDMPRTSLWRLIKRLEKSEIIEVEKIGLENQVRLKK